MLSASEVAEGIHNGLYARMDSSSIYGVCSEKSPVILLFFSSVHVELFRGSQNEATRLSSGRREAGGTEGTTWRGGAFVPSLVGITSQGGRGRPSDRLAGWGEFWWHKEPG